MEGRKTGQDKKTSVKHRDDLRGEDVMRAGHAPIQKRGEIAVFDAGKYFAGAGNQKSQIEEMEEEVDEDADAEVGGDLPLSPLPELYPTSKERHYTRRNQRQQGDKAHVYGAGREAAGTPSGGAVSSPAQRQTVPRVGPLRRMPDGRDSLPSPPSMASSGNDQLGYDEPCGPPVNITNSHSEPAASQSKSSGAKPSQPFSPSARLASFLAKFKLSSSESKSKPPCQYSSTATPPASTPSPKSFFSNATGALPANGKLTSPRGRFLRALSSSSSFTNPLLKPIAHMHHRTSIAANSTPVSPAGSDPYSPITHSASSTPTSRKNPRSRSRSHVSHLEGTSPSFKSNLPTTDWRRDLDNSSRHSLSTHLPLLRRKLKAYLMPEKSPRQHHAETQNQLRSKQKEVNINNVSAGAHADQNRQRRSGKAPSTSISVLNKPQVATLLSEARDDEDRQQRAYKDINAASTPDKARAAHTKAQPDQHKPHHNSMRSPGRLAVEPPTTKDTRRRGDWRKHAEDILEDDIEVAERLLRVVKEHQSSKTYTSSYKGTSNYKQQSNGYGAKGQGHMGGDQMVNAGSSSRKSRRSFASPSSSPAAANYYSKQASKEEFACPYDSDSSSDLFEIESFSHVAGLYRPHELPVYDSNPLKSPLHLK